MIKSRQSYSKPIEITHNLSVQVFQCVCYWYFLRCFAFRVPRRDVVSNEAPRTTALFAQKMLPTNSLADKVKTCSSIGAKAIVTPSLLPSATIRRRPHLRQHRQPVLAAVCKLQKASLRAKSGLRRSRRALRLKTRIMGLPKVRAATRFRHSVQRVATTSVHPLKLFVHRTI